MKCDSHLSKSFMACCYLAYQCSHQVVPLPDARKKNRNGALKAKDTTSETDFWK